MDHRGPSPALQRNAIAKPGVIKSGIVEGKKISKILLDTGCSRTLVHQDLVPAEKILEEAVAIRCAHGDTLLYPLAQVSMVVDGISIEAEAAVSSTLPMGVLLGTDTKEQLMELLMDNTQVGEAYAVTTRAAKKKEEEEEKKTVEKERDHSVTPHTLEVHSVPLRTVCSRFNSAKP